MKVKSLLLVVSLLIITALTAEACAATTSTTESNSESTPQLELTLEELMKYSGKDGNPAYIAVNGIIYDVTKSALWKNGAHNGYEAGKDLSAEINKSPHGKAVLKNIPVVGKLKI